MSLELNPIVTRTLSFLALLLSEQILFVPIAIGQPSTVAAEVEQASSEPHAPKFIKASECALCHSFAKSATAMRDSNDRNVAPYDLWSGSMMANSAVDPYWRAALSAEVATTPAQRAHIVEVCTRCHAPMASPVHQSPVHQSPVHQSPVHQSPVHQSPVHQSPVHQSPEGQVLAFLRGSDAKAQLGKDGVSCTVCHQISSDKLGTEASYTGGFVIKNDNAIYGPHSNPLTMPMERHVGYTPKQGEQILSSAMCATCHTVITESFDKKGIETHIHLHEQVPYFEWRNSIFNNEVDSNRATAQSCQSCHVPQTDVDGATIKTKLAHNPGGRDFPFLNPREPYGRHTFAGGNVFMTQLLRDNRLSLGIQTPVEAFDRVIQDSRKMLQNATAKLALSISSSNTDQTTIAVNVENLSGHKFPTAYPSRRAWIELIVRDQVGKIVFASGQVNSSGQIIGSDGTPLATELANGSTQPHFQSISSSSQVQIFETFMEDSEKDLTFALLRGSRFRKDNRLLPKGWSDQHEHAEATRPQGVGEDSDFQAGTDTVHYELALPPGNYTVEARLLFQSLSSRYIAELLKLSTDEIRAFADLYKKANLAPEVIAKGSISLDKKL